MPLTQEQIDNGGVDLDNLGAIVNGAADINGTGLVPTRTGGPVKTLAKVIADAEAVDIGGPLAASLGARTDSMAANLDGLQYLHHDAQTLTGLAAGLTWDATTLMLARAIKSVFLEGHGISATDDYYIGQIAVDDATVKDQIVLRKVSDNSQLITNGTATAVTKRTDGPTEVLLTNETNSARARLLIDYREITGTGKLLEIYSLTRPLILSRAISSVERDRARLFGERMRNIAYNGALTNAGAGTSFQGAGPQQAPVAAHAELTARGVAYSKPFGSNSTATAIYKRDLAVSRMNGKFVYVSAYVYSANPAAWPANGMVLFPYDAATGGAIVAGSTSILQTYEQVTPNLRRYWSRYKMPTAGNILSIAYGFNGVVSGAVAELGGFTLAIGENEMGPFNVATDDWTGYSTSGKWREAVDASVAALQASALVSHPYYNEMTNPNLDPEGSVMGFTVATTQTAPTALEMAEAGIKQVVQIGTGGGQAFTNDPILTADDSGKYVFASVYIYSADGVTWPTVRAYYYAEPLANAGNFLLDGIVQVSANVRLYYGSSQLPVRSDLRYVRMGPTAAVSGTVAEMGGFTFVRYRSALTLNNTARNDWYGAATRPERIAATARAVERLGGSWADKVIAYFGDSIIEGYGIPAALATELGCTVLNFGMGGTRFSHASTATAGSEIALKAEMCGVKVFQAIATGDFTAMIAAADELFANYADDNRAIVAAMAAQDWNAVTHVKGAWGTNDYSGGVDLGLEDSTTISEFNGAMNVGIADLRAAYGHLDISLSTPTWRGPAAAGGDSNLTTNSDGNSLSDFADAIINRGAYHGVPVNDLNRRLGIGVGNAALYLADDLHPTQPVGRLRWATREAAFMRATF